MPISSLCMVASEKARRWWPELMVALFASVIFLSALGWVEFWGKREQRASLEAVDTLENHNWLVARIQGHPRLEKPPLSRWLIASLMAATGRRDEWIVRLPVAISALMMMGLVYSLGKHLDGRAAGLASAMILCTTPFFIAEMRQAGNDGLLALCSTAAHYAVWRRLASGQRRWNLLFHAALGLGVLAKGPVIFLLVAVTLVPYLAVTRQLKSGLRSLADPWGFLICAGLSLSWPILVLLDDPTALGVWLLEMREKTGFGQVMEHRRHAVLAGEWPQMVLPWSILGILALALPFLRTSPPGPESTLIGESTSEAGGRGSRYWFPWFWGVGNLAMFSLWSVAKPSYYLPCLPGMTLLLGSAWVHVTRTARQPGREGELHRRVLQSQWVVLFVAACVGPLLTRSMIPAVVWPWMNVLALLLAAGVIGSAVLWRRGADALSLAPLTGACALIVWIGYGIMAPAENAQRGYRELARTVSLNVDPSHGHVYFLQEIDEGLSFHYQAGNLEPLPGSQRRYNAAFDFTDDYTHGRRPHITRRDVEARVTQDLKTSLVDWLDQNRSTSDCFLVPTKFYDRFVVDLAPRTTILFREDSSKRNAMILFRTGSDKLPSIANSSLEDDQNSHRYR